MVFLFSFFAFFAFLNSPESTPERLRFSEVSFSAAVQESSIRCLDPKSGQELSEEKVQEGVSCIAEIKNNNGVSYQYLHPKMSIDWDALAFNDFVNTSLDFTRLDYTILD